MQTKNRLHALSLTLDLVRRLGPIVDRIERRDRDLGRQIRRAASSIALNLDEGNASDGGNRRARFVNALGSARETRTALHLAAAWGYVAHDDLAALDRDLDRVAAMTFRLSRS